MVSTERGRWQVFSHSTYVGKEGHQDNDTTMKRAQATHEQSNRLEDIYGSLAYGIKNSLQPILAAGTDSSQLPKLNLRQFLKQSFSGRLSVKNKRQITHKGACKALNRLSK
ncbi:MAG: hypothetical protein AAGC93_00470 [Cyanobacteria bacterium P01_F01_bin.53]